MKKIWLFLITLCLTFCFINPSSAYSFGIGKSLDEQRPSVGSFGPMIEKYNGFYIGKNEKSVSLTFDCGYENGYTSTMLDTLKEHNITGTFFITGHYLTSSSSLVKRMIDEGHIVANHTNKHGHFTKQDVEKTLNDVRNLEVMFKEMFNQDMSKYCRPPAGEFTEESLSALSKEGYIPSFWSLAYVDWHKDVYHGNDYSYKEVMKRLHPGAIILMHTVGKDNAVDLSKIISGIKDKGYAIKTLDEIL